MRHGLLESLRGALFQKRRQISEFQEVHGENVPIREEDLRPLTLTPGPPQPHRYEHVVSQISEKLGTVSDSKRQRTVEQRKVAKAAAKEVVAAKEKAEREKAETVKRQVNNAKIVSNAVYRGFWTSSLKLLRFTSERQEKLRNKQEQERKMNQFLKTQSELADEILGEIQQQTAALKVTTAADRSDKKTRLVINLKRFGRKCFKFVGVEKKLVRRQSTQQTGDEQLVGGSLFTGRLRDYQKVGVSWLSALAMKRISCILADEMGLGKTVQTIAYFAALAEKEGIWGPHLVIVPTTVLGNWLEELERFLPSFKIFPYFGRSSDRKASRKGWSDVDKFNICLTTYRIVAIDSKIFKRRRWFSLVLDEAHLIKNAQTLSFAALHRLRTYNRVLLTGTPLQNKLTELWTLMTFIFPHKFEGRESFVADFDFCLERAARDNPAAYQGVIQKLHTILRPLILRRLKKDVERQMPKKTERVIMCELSRRQRQLYDQFIMAAEAREKRGAGIVQNLNVLMQLRKICNHPDLVDEKISNSPFVCAQIEYFVPEFVLLDPRRSLWELSAAGGRPVTKELLVALVACLHFKYRLSSRSAADFDAYLNSVCRVLRVFRSGRLAPICPSRFSMQPEPTGRGPLPTLFADYSQMSRFVETRFEHFLIPVTRCLSLGLKSRLRRETPTQSRWAQWAKLSSPSPLPSIFVNNINCFIADSGKLRRLFELLCSLRAQHKKVLVFTQMGRMLNLLELFLSHKGFVYVRLDGTTQTEMRQELVHQFSENPKIMVFISSTRVGGIGINLTAADTVVFYDNDWNPAVDKQAQDRCHRIGQSRDVTVYKLVTRASIEENILMTSNVKSKIDDMVMNKGRFNLTGMFQQILASDKGAADGDFTDVITGYLNLVEEEGDKVTAGTLGEATDQKDAKQRQKRGDDEAEGPSEWPNSDDSAFDLSMAESFVLPVFKYGVAMLTLIKGEREAEATAREAALSASDSEGSSEKQADLELDRDYYANVLGRRRPDLGAEEQEELVRAARRKVVRELALLSARAAPGE